MSRGRRDFLSRWSARKQAAREDRSRDDAAEPKPEQSPAAASVEPPPDLPDIDSLTKDSDFTVFMQENVPEVLRRQALRVLWRSDPVLANLDGLNDYDEDFRILEGVTEVVRTNFKPGQGMRASDDDVAEEEQVAEARDVPSTPDGTQTASSDTAVSSEEQQSDPDASTREDGSEESKPD
jgi:hypothetical protein